MKITKQILQDMKIIYLTGRSIENTRSFIENRYKSPIAWETVRKRLKKMGIKLRNTSEAFVLRRNTEYPTAKILSLYQKKKYGIRQISRKLNIVREIIRKILSANKVALRSDYEVQLLRRKYKRTSFDGAKLEKAYMLGLVDGDLNAHRRSKYTVRLATNSTHETLIELVRDTFKRYGNVLIYPIKNTLGGYQTHVSVELDNSFAFLLPENRKKSIFNLNRTNEFLSFLAGFIDSDGSIIIRKTGQYFQFVIRVFGQDLRLLSFIRDRLIQLRFKPFIGRTFKAGSLRKKNNIVLRYNKDYFTLDITNRPDVIRLLGTLPIRHKEKIDRRELLLKIYRSKLVRHKEIEPQLRNLRNRIDTKVKKDLERLSASRSSFNISDRRHTADSF